MKSVNLSLWMAVAAAGLCLVACGGLQQVTPGSVRLPADQGLLVAEAGADGINMAATAAAPALNAQQKAVVKGGIDTANNAVSAAHDAYVKGDLAATSTDLQNAMSAIATVEQEVKK